MTAAETALLVIGVVAVIGVVLVSLAQRVDRLHRRVISSRSMLETQLVRRAEAAAELAGGGLLDPASSVVVGEAAWDAAVHAPRLVGGSGQELAEVGVERGLVESALTMDLRAALGSPQDQAELRQNPRPPPRSTGSRTPATGPSWRGASTTTPSSARSGCGATRSCASSTWRAAPRCPRPSRWTTRCSPARPPAPSRRSRPRVWAMSSPPPSQPSDAPQGYPVQSHPSQETGYPSQQQGYQGQQTGYAQQSYPQQAYPAQQGYPQAYRPGGFAPSPADWGR